MQLYRCSCSAGVKIGLESVSVRPAETPVISFPVASVARSVSVRPEEHPVISFPVTSVARSVSSALVTPSPEMLIVTANEL